MALKQIILVYWWCFDIDVVCYIQEILLIIIILLHFRLSFGLTIFFESAYELHLIAIIITVAIYNSRIWHKSLIARGDWSSFTTELKDFRFIDLIRRGEHHSQARSVISYILRFEYQGRVFWVHSSLDVAAALEAIVSGFEPRSMLSLSSSDLISCNRHSISIFEILVLIAFCPFSSTSSHLLRFF